MTLQLNRKAPNLAMATYSPMSTFHLEHVNDDAMARFETGHKRFDAGFKHRFAAPESATAFRTSPELLDRCATLWEHWWFSLNEASITTIAAAPPGSRAPSRRSDPRPKGAHRRRSASRPPSTRALLTCTLLLPPA